MFYLIKNENIFSKFFRNVYIIEYQKRGFSHMYLLVFLYSTNQFFQISQIDEIICIKLSLLETNSTRKLIKIVTFVILYYLYRNINRHLLYINNT